MNIVLVGYRGCGKSTAGRLLAARLGWTFVDTDELIQKRTGKSIREIFADQAEEGFRDLEAQVIGQVASGDRQVISTGGGVLLREVNALALQSNGRIVWLTAPAETLWERILADFNRRTERPPINLAEGLQQVRHALEVREPLYQRWADVIVDTTNREPAAVVERILARLAIRGQ